MHNSDAKAPRGTYPNRRKAYLLPVLLLCLTLLSGCVMSEPDMDTSASVEPLASTVPLGDPVSKDTQQGALVGKYVDTVAQHEAAARMSTAAIRMPDSITVCYDGTYSMMGFVDVHGTNEYKNTVMAVGSAVSACFPAIDKQYYRVGREAEADLLESDNMQSKVSTPQFYLNQDMLTQPDRVVLEGETSASRGMRMNEPIQSYYSVLGLAQPQGSAEDAPCPASQALGLLGDNGFVVLVTDLEELQTNSALMRDIEAKVYANDMIVGITAVESSFSGFAPIWSKGEPTWFEWGAQPTGSCEIMFDCIDYQLGLTIDPDTRSAEERPFYVLCFGNSDSVNAYCMSLGQLLGVKGARYTLSIFDTIFNPIDYNMADNIDRSRFTMSQVGLNPMTLDDNRYISSLQLQGLSKKQAGDDKRWFSVPIVFMPRLSDPRIGQFTAQDFTVAAYLQKQDANGVFGERVQVMDEIVTGLNVENRTSGTSILTVSCAFPQGRLDKGAQYLITLSVLLNTPQEYNIPLWMADYDQTLDNEMILGLTNGSVAFEGNRTIGLSNLMGAIVEYQQKTAAALPVGEFGVLLNVAGS